jgi:hypothetical protein
VARVFSTAFCVALLAATAVAFAFTEGAKTELSPIYRTKVTKVFSPTCNLAYCARNTASIVFSIRKRQTITAWIVHGGNRVATLVSGRTYPKGRVRLVFTGVGADGASILPDGVYQPAIDLIGDHRTITLPNLIELDTSTPVVVRFPRRVVTHISPDGDGRNDVFRVHYTLNERAHGVLLVDGRRAVFTLSQKTHGTMTWNGTVGGQLQPPGRYVVAIAAQDAAGNRSAPIPFAVVAIRYIEIAPVRIDATRGGRFAAFVLTDARRFGWTFAGRHGVQRARVLRLRAPRQRGTYPLVVGASGHIATATVTVG